MKRILMGPIVLTLFAVTIVYTALVGTTLSDFFLSGSQPNQSGTFTSSCNCHDGYSISVEPGFNWSGNMMAQAARDPLYYATLAIANQDAAFVGDLCLRCHTPVGWLEGRSIPTDGSALIAKDRDGVQCEYCHRAVKPFASGANPYPSDPAYNSVVPGYASTSTYARDTTYLNTLSPRPIFTGNGMYVVDSDETRRGPRTDADPRHALRYSPFHRDAALCGTCHDVSNPVFSKQVDGNGNFYYTLNNLNTIPPSFNPYDHFPVERTYSEWLMSAYNTPQGVYAPQFGGNRQYVSTCQDCHMRDVTGKAATQGNVATRTDLALHDQTGGNTWVPKIIPSFYPTEVNVAALDSAVKRATYMLKNAASMEVSMNFPIITVKVTNETGHKLPSGYPEGRRIWLNVKVYNAQNALIGEYGAYDSTTGVLQASDTKVYEAKLGMSPEVLLATGLSNEPDSSSFHFALNNRVVKDNRIPPRGFTNAAFRTIQSQPVGRSYADGQYWDTTNYVLPAQANRIVVNLYYQTTSREYIEFLRDNNTTNNWGTRLDSAWRASGKSAPVLMRRYEATTTVTRQYTVSDGWNMVSIPLTVGDYTKAVLFPTAISDAYAYQGGYVAQTGLSNGIGYWLRFSGAQNISMTGALRTEQTVAVQAGWNMIGSISSPVAVGSITSDPPGLVTSQFYGYDGGYLNATTIEPGKGYWVNVSGNGTLHLSSSSMAPSLRRIRIVPTTEQPPPVPGTAITQVPKEFVLEQNNPNPFNPLTTIGFSVATAGKVRLQVFDILGKLVATLANEDMPAGDYRVSWKGCDDNGSHVVSGVYLYRLEAGGFTQTRKLMLLR